jgi:hypothetical protein
MKIFLLLGTKEIIKQQRKFGTTTNEVFSKHDEHRSGWAATARSTL